MCEENCENCPYPDLDMIPKEVNCRIAKYKVACDRK